MVFMEEDSQFAEKMRLALGIVEQSLPHLRKGLYSTEDMEAAAEIIYRSTSCAAILITDTRKILAMKSDAGLCALKGDSILAPILASLNERNSTIYDYAEKDDPFYPILKNHMIVAAPLIEMDHLIGSLTMVVKKHWHSSRSDLSFASELARLFSTQLELSYLEYQKKLRRKAEFKALQSQVNPHFLYNALNTISYVSRENSDRARELLRALSTYYRQTLENDQYMLNLHTELYHISSYLDLEKARFEEKLCVEINIDEDLNCMVPAFILQPLVENAVRYGADQMGNRLVSIKAHADSDWIEIAVSDNGTGFPQEILTRLYAGQSYGGVGLENVHKRLMSIYGQDRGLHIQSSVNGSKVYFLIPAAVSESRYVEELAATTYPKNNGMEESS